MKSHTVYGLSGIHTTADNSQSYRLYFIAIYTFYLVIAGLLALQVLYGVMDEDFHLEATKAFADYGINLTTLYRHVPPTGVASHIWFALWMRLFPDIDYIGLRLITCVSLGLLAGSMYGHLKAQPAALQQRIMAASWFMLVCPYFFLGVSTIHTEGPALLFLFSGLLLLSVSQLQSLFPFLLGCLLLGIATIARFYYIPLLPALFVVLAVTDWKQYVQSGFKAVITSRGLMYMAIGIGLLPLASLVLLWGGFTPPLFHQWSKLRSGLSFNQLRPISALLIIGVYIAPFLLLNLLREPKQLVRILRITLPIALLLAVFRVNLFHDSSSVHDVFSGPIEHGLGWIESRGNWAFGLALFIVYSVCLSSLSVFIERIIKYIRLKDFADQGFVFSVTFVFLFIISQAFIGGNHPFFDRYIIHPWPFLGYILIRLFPPFLNARTYMILAAYTVFSMLILLKWGVS